MHYIYAKSGQFGICKNAWNVHISLCDRRLQWALYVQILGTYVAKYMSYFKESGL